MTFIYYINLSNHLHHWINLYKLYLTTNGYLDCNSSHMPFLLEVPSGDRDQPSLQYQGVEWDDIKAIPYYLPAPSGDPYEPPLRYQGTPNPDVEWPDEDAIIHYLHWELTAPEVIIVFTSEPLLSDDSQYGTVTRSTYNYIVNTDECYKITVPKSVFGEDHMITLERI